MGAKVGGGGSEESITTAISLQTNNHQRQYMLGLRMVDSPCLEQFRQRSSLPFGRGRRLFLLCRCDEKR